MPRIERTLQFRLRHWIQEQVSEGAAEVYAPVLCEMLGTEPEVQLTEEQFAGVVKGLREAGITPELLGQAVREYQRSEDVTVREWVRKRYERHMPAEQAERVLSAVEPMLEQGWPGFLDQPITPRAVLSFRLMADETTAAMAAEKGRIQSGGLPTN